ncbi:nitroreductase family protein [Cohnella boryungensis]|uniref:Nitroreductase n=1 Tax=Cohnella boryungensis TaxID=768479 RepID=A0ABV8SJD1_9BACL
MSLTSLFENIRPIRHFDSRPVSFEQIAPILDDAVWAPNHRLREPWRFIVAEGEAKRQLFLTLDPYRNSQLRSMISEAPLCLIVTSPTHSDEAVSNEDFAAACCLIQNVQLLAWANGLGMAWEMTDRLNCANFCSFSGIHPGERIAGVLGLGYFDELPEQPAQCRKPLDRVDIW